MALYYELAAKYRRMLTKIQNFFTSYYKTVSNQLSNILFEIFWRMFYSTTNVLDSDFELTLTGSVSITFFPLIPTDRQMGKQKN